ncbi:MAG: tetratricopeptide repeat protein [Fidelibacterota bacterium]
MQKGELRKSRLRWLIVVMIISTTLSGLEGAGGHAASSGETGKKRVEPKLKWFSPRSLVAAFKNGDNRLFEGLVRPLEFREPIVTIPAEGRYGVGFYGWEKLNPLQFDSTLISYEGDPGDVITEVGLSGRTGSFMEVDVAQTNLSYLLFKKSYLDFLTGVGFRYSSIFPFPTLGSDSVITGPPDVPPSWGVEKSFSPTVMEGNVVTSFIMQWHPKWFVHFKYSYGVNRVRFYRDDSINSTPYGTGTSSAYSVGIKFIRESESAARYAWGFELRHIFHRVGKIHDPGDLTPISGFRLPSLGIFFTFGAFYGGHPTIGDEGKKLFLKRDYIAAKKKLSKFVNTYPDHARIRRARKLLALSNERIPFQLFSQGDDLEKRGDLDLALDKFVQARLTARGDFKKTVSGRIENVARKYVELADSLFKAGEDDKAIQAARKAAAVSEYGRKAQLLLEASVYLRQGKDLASLGFYPMALRKFEEARKLAPSLETDIRRAQLETAVGMLEDVNKATDDASVRLALQSLFQAREILGKSDDRMDRIITQLEEQLSRLDGLRVKGRIDAYMDEARDEIARRHQPRVELGMLVAQVEEILGRPQEVVERVDEKNRDYQLWIYLLPDKSKKLLYFDDYVLFKVEVEQ